MTRLETEVAPGSADQIACAGLIRALFGDGIAERYASTLSLWRQSGIFDEDGRCIAALQSTPLRWMVGNAVVDFAAIRLVGVAEDRRGCGHCRTLVELAIAANAGRGLDLNLLFSSQPALYENLGFALVDQHAFCGPMPPPETAAPARPLDVRGRDQDLAQRLLATRTLPSGRFQASHDKILFLDRLAADPDLCFAHLPDLDAMIVYEIEDDTFVLIDIAAAAIPPLARILSAFPRRTTKTKVVFGPDRLDWRGTAVREDNGLMAFGELPTAFDGAFVVPRMVEF